MSRHLRASCEHFSIPEKKAIFDDSRIYQMQVEHANAAIEHRIRAARASMLPPTPDLHIEDHLLLPAATRDQSDESPEVEVEEPGDEPGRQVINKEEANNVDILNADDIDNDPSHSTALTLHEDLLSLQNKVSRFAKSTLVPAISYESPPPDSQPATASSLATDRVSVDEWGQTPKQPTEEPTPSQTSSDRKFSGSQSTKRSSSSSRRVSIDERVQTPVSAAEATEEPVYFEDLLGNRFIFPFRVCKTYDVSWL